MSNFICPKCKTGFSKEGNSYKCANGHCFDISRKGTVNLLLSQKSRHGDDKLMVNARRSFLDKGYYTPLLKAVQDAVLSCAKDGCTILDCGCGECWYTSNIRSFLKESYITAEIMGIDVSKEAVMAGASRDKSLKLAVASVYDIPVREKSCDIVISLFAPFSPDEYRKVLKDCGYFITAFPLEEHLWELKSAVYETPYKNEVSDMEITGFELMKSEDVHSKINLCTNDDIKSLFAMTPYYYKTSEADRKKLDNIDTLETTTEFRVAVYKKLQ